MSIQIVQFEDENYGIRKTNWWRAIFSNDTEFLYDFINEEWNTVFIEPDNFKRTFIEVLEEYKNLTKKPKEIDPMKIKRVLQGKELTCYKGINL